MKNKVCYLQPKGHITTTKNDDLFEVFDSKVESEKPDYVILDLSDVGFIDSSGISNMIKISKACKKRNLGFSIKNCSKRNLELFKTLKLDLVFPIS